MAARTACPWQPLLVGRQSRRRGNLVISAYVTCPDITLTVTPDLKLPGSSRLIHVDLAEGKRRLGGSALAQVCTGDFQGWLDCFTVLRQRRLAGPALPQVSNWESLQPLAFLQQPACHRLGLGRGSGAGSAERQLSDWVASELSRCRAVPSLP